MVKTFPSSFQSHPLLDINAPFVQVHAVSFASLINFGGPVFCLVSKPDIFQKSKASTSENSYLKQGLVEAILLRNPCDANTTAVKLRLLAQC